MPSLSVPSRFKPRHRDLSSRLRGRRRKGGAKHGGNLEQVTFALFPELQVRPKALAHNNIAETHNDADINNDEKPNSRNKINSQNNNATTAIVISNNIDGASLDSSRSSQPQNKKKIKRMQQPFSHVAPYLGSIFNIHCACVDIDHVLDVEEEFDNQVFLQAKAARILKRKAVDMKQLKFGRQLGQGGNGRVFRGAYHNTPVAIKEMIAGSGGGGPEKAAADRAEDDSFIQEFEHLKSLRHPNVVQFFGAACSSNLETAEQRRVLVMELAACSLKDVVRGEHSPLGGYPVVTSLNWARQVAAGLRYIHDRRMIHFDIKLANVLVDQAGVAKICDLGVARVNSDGKGLVFSASVRAGTPSYMAPELLHGKLERITRKVDVYSFGILLWEILHRRSPHPRTWTLPQLFAQVALRDFRPAIDADIPPVLAALVRLCWVNDPDKRPTMAQVQAELEHVLCVHNDVESPSEAKFEHGQLVWVWSQEAECFLSHGVVGLPNPDGTYDIEFEDQPIQESVDVRNILPMQQAQSEAVRMMVNEISRTDDVDVSMSSIDHNTISLTEVDDNYAVDDDDDDDGGSDSSDNSQLSDEDDYTYSPSTISTAASNNSNHTHRPVSTTLATRTQKDETSGHTERVNLLPTPALPPARSRRRRSCQRDEEANTLLILRRENRRLRQARAAGSDRSMPVVVNVRASGSRGALQHLMGAHRAVGSEPMFQVGLGGSTSAGLGGEASSESASDVSTSLGSTLGNSENLPLSDRQAVLSVGEVRTPRSLLIPLEDSMQGDSFGRDQVSLNLNSQLREGPMKFGINILNQIGTHTYRAYHFPTMSLIAVKVITVHDKKRIKRIKNELDTYAKGLRHPNLLFYSCTFGMRATSTLLMVYELMEGGSLHLFLSLTQGRTPKYLVRNDETPSLHTPNRFMLLVARSIGAGLAYLHGRGVIHREVRPSSVVMNKRRTLIKLADLGRAYQLQSDQTSTFTPAGMANAALFTAPERLRGEKYSSAVDVWSLGMCLLCIGLERVSPLADKRESDEQDTGRVRAQLEQLVRMKNGVEVVSDWDESAFGKRMGVMETQLIVQCLNADPSKRPTAAQVIKLGIP